MVALRKEGWTLPPNTYPEPLPETPVRPPKPPAIHQEFFLLNRRDLDPRARAALERHFQRLDKEGGLSKAERRILMEKGVLRPPLPGSYEDFMRTARASGQSAEASRQLGRLWRDYETRILASPEADPAVSRVREGSIKLLPGELWRAQINVRKAEKEFLSGGQKQTDEDPAEILARFRAKEQELFSAENEGNVPARERQKFWRFLADLEKLRVAYDPKLGLTERLIANEANRFFSVKQERFWPIYQKRVLSLYTDTKRVKERAKRDWQTRLAGIVTIATVINLLLFHNELPPLWHSLLHIADSIQAEVAGTQIALERAAAEEKELLPGQLEWAGREAARTAADMVFGPVTIRKEGSAPPVSPGLKPEGPEQLVTVVMESGQISLGEQKFTPVRVLPPGTEFQLTSPETKVIYTLVDNLTTLDNGPVYRSPDGSYLVDSNFRRLNLDPHGDGPYAFLATPDRWICREDGRTLEGYPKPLEKYRTGGIDWDFPVYFEGGKTITFDRDHLYFEPVNAAGYRVFGLGKDNKLYFVGLVQETPDGVKKIRQSGVWNTEKKGGGYLWEEFLNNNSTRALYDDGSLIERGTPGPPVAIIAGYYESGYPIVAKRVDINEKNGKGEIVSTVMYTVDSKKPIVTTETVLDDSDLARHPEKYYWLGRVNLEKIRDRDTGMVGTALSRADYERLMAIIPRKTLVANYTGVYYLLQTDPTTGQITGLVEKGWNQKELAHGVLGQPAGPDHIIHTDVLSGRTMIGIKSVDANAGYTEAIFDVTALGDEQSPDELSPESFGRLPDYLAIEQGGDKPKLVRSLGHGYYALGNQVYAFVNGRVNLLGPTDGLGYHTAVVLLAQQGQGGSSPEDQVLR